MDSELKKSRLITLDKTESFLWSDSVYQGTLAPIKVKNEKRTLYNIDCLDLHVL
jgi:hypothetical protein